MNRLAVPWRTHAQSRRATWPGRTGREGRPHRSVACSIRPGTPRDGASRRAGTTRRARPPCGARARPKLGRDAPHPPQVRLQGIFPQHLAQRFVAQVRHNFQGHPLLGHAQTALPFRSIQRFLSAGGSEQASAISRASCDPSSLRAYRRELGLGRSAADKPSSTKRRRTRSTVRTLTRSASEVAASDQPGPLSDASACGKTRARVSLRASARPREIIRSSAARSFAVSVTRHRLAIPASHCFHTTGDLKVRHLPALVPLVHDGRAGIALHAAGAQHVPGRGAVNAVLHVVVDHRVERIDALR